MTSRFIRWSVALTAATAVAVLFWGGGASGIGTGSPAPEFKGGPWLNSSPLKMKDLRGKVVLVEMWTFG